MELVETTISEPVYNQGLAFGLAKGKAEGLSEGLLEGQLMLENLHQLGILSDAQKNSMMASLQQKLKNLMQ